ncbi:hypothetical protein Tco_1338131 [Tanacetum coccineum]
MSPNSPIYRGLKRRGVEISNLPINLSRDVEVDLENVGIITEPGEGEIKKVSKLLVSASPIRRHLKLEDSEGLSSLPNAEIFEQLANMGYVTDSDSLTFQKGHFSPQWKFFIHTILYCLSPKKTAWDQFSSNLATAIICLATKRIFNFSKFLFEAMVKNIDSQHKFLMYPRFIQIFVNKHQRLLLPHKTIYPTPTLKHKLFNNMKRVSKGYSRVVTPLFDTMIAQVLSLNVLDGFCIPPYQGVANLESELKQEPRNLQYCSYKLISGVKKFQSDQSEDHLRVLSAAKVLAEAAKQGRGVGLTQTYTKRRRNVGTGSSGVSTSSDSNNTAGGKAKDKGKEIMQEPEPLKKLKKGWVKLDELDGEIAKEIEEEQARKLDAREEVPAEATQAIQEHEIDWNDPSVLRYHTQLNRPYSVAEVRKNMIMYLKNQGGYKMSYFQRKESKEKAKERMKRKTSKAREDKIKRQKTKDDPEKLTLMEYVQVVSDSEEAINVIPLVLKSPKQK